MKWMPDRVYWLIAGFAVILGLQMLSLTFGAENVWAFVTQDIFGWVTSLWSSSSPSG